MSRHGFNLVLVDEDQEHLNHLKDKITGSGIDVKLETLPFDFKKKMSWEDYEKLYNSIKDITKD